MLNGTRKKVQRDRETEGQRFNLAAFILLLFTFLTSENNLKWSKNKKVIQVP
jgi:hypothetical protein